ncbi:MAG: Glu/Leu/Phe/Val dehydrogenase [Candidatus Paceibacterota bacterium]
MEAKRTAFDKYLAQLDNAAKVLNLDPRIYERLKVPALLVRGKVRVEMDDKTFKEFNVFRCQHNHARGPTQGGTRFSEKVCESEIKFLASMMTMKNTIGEIRNGGGKGGICVDKRPLSLLEGELMCRGYINVIAPYIGEKVDGPAPDVNTGAREMAWFMAEYDRLTGQHNFAQFTGKPLELGGSLGRGDATALGAVYATEAMMKKLGLKGPLTIAQQGFGNAGDFYAKLMTERGHIVESVSDTSGVIYKKGGFDYKDLHNFCYAIVDGKEKKIRKVTEYDKYDAVAFAKEIKDENGEVIRTEWTVPTKLDPREEALKADIFAPAAFEDLIDADMARKIKCKFIVELANGPCTEEADAILAKRGIPVIPDIYSSGGGVFVSSLEKNQGFENYQWPARRVGDMLKEQMLRKSFDNLEAVREEFKLNSMRQAAMVYAVREVAKAMTWLGGFHLPYGVVLDRPTVVMYQDGRTLDVDGKPYPSMDKDAVLSREIVLK